MSLINIKRENNNFECFFNSSNILACKYNMDSKNLNILFNKGGNYIYSDILLEEFLAFSASESQGKYINKNFKNKVFTKEKSILVDKVLDFINESIKNYDKSVLIL